jgi:hypothetical protein
LEEERDKYLSASPFDRRENEEVELGFVLTTKGQEIFPRGRGTWVKKRFKVGQEGEE